MQKDYFIEVGSFCYSKIWLYTVRWNLELTWKFPTPIQYIPSLATSSYLKFEMAPSMFVNFISLVTSCIGLREEKPQTAFSMGMSFTWASHRAASVVKGHQTLSNWLNLQLFTRYYYVNSVVLNQASVLTLNMLQIVMSLKSPKLME